MVASLDGAATDAERRSLAAHLGECVACRSEDEEARRLAVAFERLGSEVGVPAALEDAVIRRVRTLEEDRPTVAERLRAWLSTPVLVAGAAVAVVVLVVAVGDRGSRSTGPGPVALPRAVEPPPVRVAAADPAPQTATARDEPGEERTARVATATVLVPPSEPPPDLTASLPLLLDMPILRNMEKLENFDRIEALTLADDAGTNG